MPKDYPNKPQSDYVMDPESTTEMVRLINQERLMTQGMGGIFPERSGDLEGIDTILDIGCGPGGWTLDVAHQYQHKRVIGIDISTTMIEYARALAFSQHLDNAEFHVMDAHIPTSFEDSSIDLINGRFVQGFTPTRAWPAFLAECLRILKPGGIFRWTEGDVSSSTSPSYDKLNIAMGILFKKMGYSFSPEGSSIGIAIGMRRLMQQAGFANIQKMAHGIETSPTLPGYTMWTDNIKMIYLTVKPAMLKLQVMPEEEYDRVYNQAVMDMLSNDFYALAYLLTVWGTKP